jgi:two-component system response regulator (stage 0 sporulation protein A)
MDAVRIIVAEDNALTREMIVECIAAERDLRVIGAAANGLEALNYLRQEDADVLILDMIMPRMDGFALLEQLQRIPRKPGVIALTSLGRGDFITRALALGVDEYMLKPYDPSLLLERIRTLAAARMRRPELPRPPTTHESRTASPENIIRYVSSMLLTAGIPAHICGFQYLREAILMVVDNPECMHGMTQHLYPPIAKHFETTPSRVERSIRNAIETMWNRGTPETIERVFGGQAGKLITKPSNGEFIALAAERIRMRPQDAKPAARRAFGARLFADK